MKKLLTVNFAEVVKDLPYACETFFNNTTVRASKEFIRLQISNRQCHVYTSVWLPQRDDRIAVIIFRLLSQKMPCYPSVHHTSSRSVLLATLNQKQAISHVSLNFFESKKKEKALLLTYKKHSYYGIEEKVSLHFLARDKGRLG